MPPMLVSDVLEIGREVLCTENVDADLGVVPAGFDVGVEDCSMG